MKNGLKIAGALLVGAAAGVLLAPRSGKESRKMIVDKTNDIKDQIDQKLTQISEKAKNTFSKAEANGKA